MNLLTSLRKELIEQWRTYRLLVLCLVLLVFGLSSPLLAKYTPELLKLIPGAEQFAGLVPKPTLLDAVAQYVKNIGQFGVLLALLMSMGSMVAEKERGTAAGSSYWPSFWPWREAFWLPWPWPPWQAITTPWCCLDPWIWAPGWH